MFGIFQKTKRRGKRLSAEMNYGTFEEKRLLAGNVVVNDGAQLFIRGDSENNQIEVIGNDDGSLSIIGKDGTTINGSSDPLVITGGGETFKDGTVTAIYESGLRAHMGAGNDKIFVQGIEFQDNSFIYGGLGDDIVSVFRSSFTDRLVVQTFSGDDAISLDESTVEGNMRLIGLDGDDMIGISATTLMGDSIVAGGNGNDRLSIGMRQQYAASIGTTETVGRFTALGGSGDDAIGLYAVQNNGFLGAFGGEGDDSVWVTENGSSDLDSIRIGGQSGGDRYSAPEEVAVGTFEDVDDGLPSFGDNRFYIDMLVNGARVPTMFEFVWWNGAMDKSFSSLTFNDVMYDSGPINYELTEGENLTLFVPTDEAFEKLGDALDGLSDEQVQDILSFHFAEGDFFASDVVATDSIATKLGTALSVAVDDDGVKLNDDATLFKTDIRIKNGVVHALNEVMIPEGVI